MHGSLYDLSTALLCRVHPRKLRLRNLSKAQAEAKASGLQIGTFWSAQGGQKRPVACAQELRYWH